MSILPKLRKTDWNHLALEIVAMLRLPWIIPKIAREGLIGTTRAALRNLFNTRLPIGTEFDAHFGADTAGNDPQWRYKVTSKNAVFGNGYEPCDERDFLRALSMIEEDFNILTFFDIGCGKGKTLLLASDLGFKELVGVEFVPELVEVARMNLRNKNIQNGTIIHADAAEYEFTNNDCVVYLFNPFERQVMTKVIANLAKLKHRTLYVVYCNPRLAADFDQCGFLTPVGSAPGRYFSRIWRSIA
jgi:SAM-dependent methyltransferase